uniref:Calcineurin-like phosphoesterase domain-containing protein n=1 Tax=Aegilops tauschii subsp. strangulata TaxID=200361 RepID=A0A453IJE7_AEGTS
MAVAALRCAPAAAELPLVEHPAKNDGSLSLLVIGDWGRNGTYNQSRVADQDLDEAMKKSTAKWKIAIGHHTIRSVSDHGDTKELLQLLLPVLKVNGIDFYINGHDHCLEHISSRDSPIQYFTSGGGSKAWRGVYQPNDDKLQFFYDGQGFMSLQLNQDQADFIFYDVSGKVLYKWSSRKTNYFQPSIYVTAE